jgi:hypothetical protein
MSWLFWWNVDQAEIDRQVEGYKTLGLFKSARKLSVFFLGLSMIITALFVYLSQLATQPLIQVDTSAFVDVSAMGFLALFIYLGHRWAMIGAMVLWTIEKVSVAMDAASNPHPNGGLVFVQVAWWAMYMHAFYLAFKVEQQRRRIALLGDSRLTEVTKPDAVSMTKPDPAEYQHYLG